MVMAVAVCLLGFWANGFCGGEGKADMGVYIITMREASVVQYHDMVERFGTSTSTARNVSLYKGSFNTFTKPRYGKARIIRLDWNRFFFFKIICSFVDPAMMLMEMAQKRTLLISSAARTLFSEEFSRERVTASSTAIIISLMDSPFSLLINR